MAVGGNELVLLIVAFLASLVSLDIARGAMNSAPTRPAGAVSSLVSAAQRWQQRVVRELMFMERNSTAAAASLSTGILELSDELATGLQDVALRRGSGRRRLPTFAAARELRQRASSEEIEFAQLAASLERAINQEIHAIDQVLENATYVRNTADKLVYQLRNFAPMKSRFAREQWNDVSMDQRRRLGLPERSFVIAMSTVNRATNYLSDTLTNMISHMSEAELRSVKMVVLNAERPPSAHRDIPVVRERFQGMIDAGQMVIVEHVEGVDELSHSRPLAQRWGDDERRIRWRSKQVLDVAAVLDRVQREEASGFPYVLMVEDDIVSAVNFVTCIRRWVDSELRNRTSWTVASFYNPWSDVADGEELPPYKFFGVIGQLFRVHDLPVVVEFLRKNFDQSPLDWLFVDFLKKFNGSMVVHVPSLFQHQGKVSSFAGKEQNGASENFVEVC